MLRQALLTLTLLLSSMLMVNSCAMTIQDDEDEDEIVTEQPNDLNQPSATKPITPKTTLNNISILKPYEAKYIAYRKGDEVGNGVRKLSKLNNDQFKLSMYIKASVFLFKTTSQESSIFKWQNDELIPLQYDYRNTRSMKKTRTIKQIFDWQNLVDQGRTEKDNWSEPLQQGTTDRLSHQLLMRQDVAANTTDIQYKVSDRSTVKYFNYEVVKHETIQTPYGKLDTVLIKRERSNGKRVTNIWLAKSLDYIPVRIQQTKEGTEQANILLSEFKWQQELSSHKNKTTNQ